MAVKGLQQAQGETPGEGGGGEEGGQEQTLKLMLLKVQHAPHAPGQHRQRGGEGLQLQPGIRVPAVRLHTKSS